MTGKHSTRLAAASHRQPTPTVRSTTNHPLLLLLVLLFCRYMFFFPLEANHVVVNRLGQPPYTACFGPGEALSLTLIQQGQKLPCGYSINRWGNFDYW